MNKMWICYTRLLMTNMFSREISVFRIIDYIDMNEENRKKVLEIFKNCIKEDRSKVQIVGFTPLNLLELTRKHMWS